MVLRKGCCMKMSFKRLCAGFLFCTFLTMNFNGAVVASEYAVSKAVPSYQGKVEHLSTYKKTAINTVNIYDKKSTINKGNVMKIAFAENFSTKTAQMGDNVVFVLKKDLKTQEGRMLLPAGTKIVGTVDELSRPKNWNKNATVKIGLGEVILPDGQKGSISAQINTKNAVLKRSSWAAVGKASLWTVGLFGVGAGVGAAIGAAASAVGTGCLAIGMPTGGGLGLIIGSATKGLQYKAKPGKTIYIQLTEDLEITTDTL